MWRVEEVRREDQFINPYTFVPFPDPGDIVRKGLAGHCSLAAGRYSGEISVTARALTRIVIGGWEAADKSPLLPWRPGPADTRQAIIPGSSLAGAVRSLHESLAGGCLRVFDREFLPTYRDIAARDSFNGLELAVVATVDDTGRPTSLVRCRRVMWTDAIALTATLSEALRSGMPLAINEADIRPVLTRGGRTIVTVAEAVLADRCRSGTWVVLVGDAGAREDVKEFRVALGQVAGPPTPVDVSEVWDAYQRSALGSADMRSQRKDPASLEKLRCEEAGHTVNTARLTSLVEWKGHEIGRRQVVRPWTRPGIVLWVRVKGDKVSDIRRAVLWRSLGGNQVAGNRVPQELLACTELDALCPSCRVFGSADVEGKKPGDPALQKSYAGHVRFTDMLASGRAPDDGPVLALAPLSSPRPGAGQFYLDNGSRTLPRARGDVLRRWGSAAGDSPRRLLRGRKYYWLTTPSPDQGPPRWKRRHTHTNEEVLTSARAFPVQQLFVTLIRFDGLTEAEIGGLLAAVQPSLMIERASTHRATSKVCLPIGGGKAFGFGALNTEVRLERVESAVSRYGTGEPPQITLDSAVQAFCAEVPDGIRRRVWPALSAVLTLDHVAPARVWYPPGATWSEHTTNTKESIEEFDEGYEFWKMTQGERLKDEDRPLVPLPDPTAGAEEQYLPIIRKSDRR